jgi:hypothetical protein
MSTCCCVPPSKNFPAEHNPSKWGLRYTGCGPSGPGSPVAVLTAIGCPRGRCKVRKCGFICDDGEKCSARPHYNTKGTTTESIECPDCNYVLPAGSPVDLPFSRTACAPGDLIRTPMPDHSAPGRRMCQNPHAKVPVLVSTVKKCYMVVVQWSVNDNPDADKPEVGSKIRGYLLPSVPEDEIYARE